MLEYIRLQMKLARSGGRGARKGSTALTWVFGIIVVCVVLALLYVLSLVLHGELSAFSARELSALFFTVIELGLAVMAVSQQMKRLYRPKDIQITARFPLSPFRLYLANLILVYINLAIVGAILTVPVMAVFCAGTGSFVWQTVFGLLLAALAAPLMPFAVSTIVAVPVMYLLTLLENRNVIRMAIFIVFLAGFFVLYNYVLSMLTEYFLHSGVGQETVSVWDGLIRALNSPFNVAAYCGNLLFFENFWAGLGIVLGVFVVLTAAGLLLSRPVYVRVHRKALETGGSVFRRRSRVDGYGPAAAMLRHGFKEILRTRAYAYFYLGIAIATPVMVFFCNRLVTEAGQAQIGSGVNFGASVLVLTVFMAMISAFSAASLSMEGKTFYITKLVPVSYRKQLLIKSLLNLCVSAGALLISCTVLGVMRFLTPGQTCFLAVAELLCAAGFVLNGVNINLINPNLKVKADGETDEINITLMMILGIFIGAVLGAAAIILPFLLEEAEVWLILLAAAAVYFGVNACVFAFTAKKRYNRIEI